MGVDGFTSNPAGGFGKRADKCKANSEHYDSSNE
jgi:hypothetical protein